jgi:hypothetical protein
VEVKLHTHGHSLKHDRVILETGSPGSKFIDVKMEDTRFGCCLGVREKQKQNQRIEAE